MAELAQFMESLGHGLPAHQLEEMIKDMGMDEDIDRTIFLDGFLPELSEAGRSWRSIFRPSFLELLEREGHSTRIIFRSTFLEFMRRTLVADLPSSKIAKIHHLFREALERTAPHHARSYKRGKRGAPPGASLPALDDFDGTPAPPAPTPPAPAPAPSAPAPSPSPSPPAPAAYCTAEGYRRLQLQRAHAGEGRLVELPACRRQAGAVALKVPLELGEEAQLLASGLVHLRVRLEVAEERGRAALGRANDHEGRLARHVRRPEARNGEVIGG